MSDDLLRPLDPVTTPAGSIRRLLLRLEAAHGVTSDMATIEYEYIRANGTRYTIRHLAKAADVADRGLEAVAALQRRIEQRRRPGRRR